MCTFTSLSDQDTTYYYILLLYYILLRTYLVVPTLLPPAGCVCRCVVKPLGTVWCMVSKYVSSVVAVVLRVKCVTRFAYIFTYVLLLTSSP